MWVNLLTLFGNVVLIEQGRQQDGTASNKMTVITAAKYLVKVYTVLLD